MPHFHDLPDGTSSINHTGSSEDACLGIDEFGWCHIEDTPAPPVTVRQVREALSPPPHPSYADGSAPLMPPQMTATQVNEARRRAEWRPIPAVPPNPNPVGYSRDFLPPCSPQHDNAPAPYPLYPETGAHTSRRSPRRARRGPSDPDAAMRKDPNAWSLREAVELCKLLEVVVPEAGFHIALTGGLLYKEGRRKDCDLMFYQIRQVDPNYEVLWKYLTVAGVIRSPSYPENGWLVKATYRGKQIDCLFPNAKKVKKAEGTPKGGYSFSPPTPIERALLLRNAGVIDETIAADREEERRTGIFDPTLEARARMAAPPTVREGYVVNPAWEAGESVLVRHNDGAPIIYHRIPDDLEEFLASNDPAPVPSHAVGRHNTAIGANSLASNNAGILNTEIGFGIEAIRAQRQTEAAAEAQDDIPF